MYTVSEIFYSIQGEGMHSGLPAIFLRLAFCNLWPVGGESVSCPFCDTPQLHSGIEMSLERIVHDIRGLRKARTSGLVITGGEPCLQIDQELIDLMSSLFPWVDLETNGSIQLKAKYDPRRVFISCSPKTPMSTIKVNPSWWKILIPDKEDLLQEVVAHSPHVPVYLQPTMPAEGMDTQAYRDSMDRCASLALEHGFGVSLQLHKYLGLQ